MLVIVEGFVDFDYEITLLTVRHCGGTLCDPLAIAKRVGTIRSLAASAHDLGGVRKVRTLPSK